MRNVSLDDIAAVTAKAGALAMAQWRGDFKVWDKSPGHQVCDVDIAVDDFLRERLAALDPDAGFLSEEVADNKARLDCARVWVVDPIDGTRDFIRGRPGWSVSVALIENNEPRFGVLSAPARDELWLAEAGQGATFNGDTLVCSERDDIVGARIPSIDLPKTTDNLVAVEKPNSIALRIGMVAADRADIVASGRMGGEWDVAAAALIAREAGATITDAYGEPLRFNTESGKAQGLAVAPPGIHDQLLTRMRQWAEKDRLAKEAKQARKKSR